MNRSVRGPLTSGVWVLAAVLACGCDKSAQTRAGGTGAEAAAGTSADAVPAAGFVGGAGNGNPAAAAAKPGYATGRVTTADGKPVAVPNAKIILSIYGVSNKSGEKLSYDPKVKPDGSYEQRLADGSYHFSMAKINVPFNGQHYLIGLEPVGDDQSDRDSDKGIVQNYIWKTTGLRPGQDADESNFTHYYGGSVNMQYSIYRDDIKKSVPPPPAGTKFVFTLTPKGKLIDGSEGKTLTFTRDFDPLMGRLKNGNLPDVPIGVYTVSGEEITPGGARKPLLIQQAYAKYGPSTKVEFAPGASTGAWPVSVGFARDAN